MVVGGFRFAVLEQVLCIQMVFQDVVYHPWVITEGPSRSVLLVQGDVEVSYDPSEWGKRRELSPKERLLGSTDSWGLHCSKVN